MEIYNKLKVETQAKHSGKYSKTEKKLKEINNLNWQIMIKTKTRMKPLNDLDCMVINYHKIQRLKQEEEKLYTFDSVPNKIRKIFLPVFG